MTKEDIAVVLKKIRQDAGYTQKEIAEKLGKKQQTIASWETGQSQPDANTLFFICSVCGTTVDEAFGFNKKYNDVTSSEYDHIKKYRRLPDRDRELVDQHMDRALEVADQADQLQETVDQLQEALASREEPEEEPQAPEYDHLTVIAAHNDHATEPGQLELMRQDVERAKKLIAERKKK